MNPASEPQVCANAQRQPRVAVIGAGKVGSTLAQRVAEKNLADVVLLDIVEGWPQGIALDLMQARGLEGHDRTIIGTNDYADTADSDVVVITAGRPRTPGMDRSDLIKTNASIVVNAAKEAIAQSPNAIFIIVTNPLDVMTYLAWEATGLPQQRVMGMAGVLDSSRLQAFIAMELGVSMQDVQTLVLGNHGKQMIPVPGYCTVKGIPLPEMMDAATIERLIDRTRHGGSEIVGLMQRGGAYFAPASSIYVMVESILCDRGRVVSAAAYLQGEYGIEGLFLGVPCQLGREGVRTVMELPLEAPEQQAFLDSAATVRQNIDIAHTLLAGNPQDAS
ncbi:malate dehydrogenase [Geitlerinema sp. P-1104]|uniref:malate dehydrogenase n=1 Tax=Geitlerinema sp. P-1104 TaxID=2546230 RepID=UPI0014772AEC|nr:malate dehydrogenase [Geitlerinema sp. P-1104]NMG60561.1 malate dehydrogenase [Geitlerinema sp. P-1104]